MRIANHLGAAAMAALLFFSMADSPALAARIEGTAAASAEESDVPDLQETSEEGDPFPGNEIPADVADQVLQVSPTGCGRGGTRREVWDAVKKPWSVTHQKGYENFTGSTAKYTKKATHERTLEAKFEAGAEVTGSGNAYVLELEGKVSFSLALTGKKTNTNSEEVTAEMKPDHVYIFYAGARKVTSSFTQYMCNIVTWVKVGTANVRSFGSKREGAVQCGTKVDKSSLGYVAERDYC